MRRRGVVLALAAIGCGRAAAQAARGAAGRDIGTAGAPGTDARSDPGLLRLEAALARHLAAGSTTLPWRETIFEPDKARLVWLPRSLRARKSRESYRVAIDPPTRWYYVGRFGRDDRLTLYGPLDERAKGRFVDVLASDPMPAPAAPESVPGARASDADSGSRPGAGSSR